MEKLHGEIAWRNCMDKLHGEIAWRNCMEKLHGEIAWTNCMDELHGQIAWRNRMADICTHHELDSCILHMPFLRSIHATYNSSNA